MCLFTPSQEVRQTAEMTEVLATTVVTIAFAATGGGTLAEQILQCMESAINCNAKAFIRHG